MAPKTKPTPPPDGDDEDEDGASMQFEAGLTRISGKIQLGKLDVYGVVVLGIIGVIILGIVVGFVAVRIWGKA